MDPLLLPLAQAAAACYAPGVVYSWETPRKLVHVLASQVNGVLTFAFAGTLSFNEWLIDFLVAQEPDFEHDQLGWVHAGFLQDAQAAVDAYIAPTLAAAGWPAFYLAAHSKGSGEAVLAHGILKAMGHPPAATRAFEAPRCGGATLTAYLADQNVVWTQTFNAEGDDIVTKVPFGPTWEHCGAPVRLRVPDDLDLAQKHRTPAVLAAIGGLG